MVVAPCLTVKPHPDWCTLWDPVVTVFLNEKLDLWLWVHFASWPLSACSALILRFSGRIECLIVVPKMVWVPFPSLISFTCQLATQDLPRPSLHLFVSFTDFLMFFFLIFNSTEVMLWPVPPYVWFARVSVWFTSWVLLAIMSKKPRDNFFCSLHW